MNLSSTTSLYSRAISSVNRQVLMFTIKIEFVHKMHYFKEQCETEECWRAQLPASAVSEPKLQNHAKEENM